MSWSVYTMARPDDVTDRVNALTPLGDSFPARDDQVKVAKTAALAIIASKAVGEGEAFAVTLGGHANENHKPVVGYANDTISITVSQIAESNVDTFDQQQKQYQTGLQ